MTPDELKAKVRRLRDIAVVHMTTLAECLPDDIGKETDDSVRSTLGYMSEALARRQAYDIVLAMLEDSQPSDD